MSAAHTQGPWIVGKRNRIQTELNAQGGCVVIVGECAIGDATDAKRIVDCVNLVQAGGHAKSAAILADLYLERDRLDREIAKRDNDNSALRAENARLHEALQATIPSLERLALEEARANQAPTGLPARTNAKQLIEQARTALAKAAK